MQNYPNILRLGRRSIIAALCLLTVLILPHCTTNKTASQSTAQSAEKPRRIEILFLGDNGHHRPIEQMPLLMAALGPKGINLTYSDNLADLNATNLAKYDGLLIYANWDSIPAAPYKPISLSKDRPEELVATLKNNNMFWRQAAQRLLVERGQKDVVPQLIALLKDQSLDEIGINPGAIHALWTLQGIGALDGSDANALAAAQAALKHPCYGVRKTAVQVLPRNASTTEALLQANALTDKEPLVVLNTLLAFSELPLTPAAENAILARLEAAKEVEDRWLPDALACVLTSNNGKLMQAYLKKAISKTGTQPKTQMSQASTSASTTHNHAAMNHNQTQAQNGTATVRKASMSGNQPDLVVTNIRTEPATPYVRESVRMFIEVKNQGGAALPKGTPTPLAIRIAGSGRVINLVSMVHSDGIAPGETVTIERGTNGPWTGPLSFNSEKAGTYTVTVVTDRDNQIAESSESNNTFNYKINYQGPQNLSVYAMECATRSYASVAPVDSVIALLRASQKLDPMSSQAIIRGVTDGWGTKRTATVRDADKSFVASLSKTASLDNQDRINRLMIAWGLKAAEEKVDLDAQIVIIKVVREALQFDKKEFTVKAGKAVEVVIENPDAMQHNMVIGKPKSLEIIGAAADKMITAKDGAEKNYVPAIPQVVAATPLINPDQTYRFRFNAPAQPGNYPFVCTFPGHWRIMNGIMKVE